MRQCWRVSAGECQLPVLHQEVAVVQEAPKTMCTITAPTRQALMCLQVADLEGTSTACLLAVSGCLCAQDLSFHASRAGTLVLNLSAQLPNGLRAWNYTIADVSGEFQGIYFMGISRFKEPTACVQLKGKTNSLKFYPKILHSLSNYSHILS